MGIIKNFLKGFRKTKVVINKKLDSLTFSDSDSFYEELEYILISSDISVSTVSEMMEKLRERVKSSRIKENDIEVIKSNLKEIMIEILDSEMVTPKTTYPTVIMVAGVNGVGKTTTLGKLGNYFNKQKKTVTYAAADTFRAGAAEQLKKWAKRTGSKLISHEQSSDPSAVVFDAISSVKARNRDVLLIDTAGRLHNKKGLMEELKKIDRTVSKNCENFSYEKLLVIDATIGQNALSQVEYFNEAIGIDGLILTKIDGTAKGGIVLSIVNEYKIPIKFIGFGEDIEDLDIFSSEKFVNSII